MKNLSTILLCFVLFGLSSLQAQESIVKREKGKAFSRNSIYVGILGPSVPASLNYERIWTKNGVCNIGTKIGGFYSKFSKYNDLTIANGGAELTLIFGRGNNLFDMGFGWFGYYGSFYSEKESKTKMYGIPTQTFSMHYRFQKPTGGVFFKGGFAASTILAFISNDLTELAIGNAIIYGVDKLTGSKLSFSLISLGVGYSFPK